MLCKDGIWDICFSNDAADSEGLISCHQYFDPLYKVAFSLTASPISCKSLLDKHGGG